MLDSFSYHRGVASMMWVLLGIAVMEMVVVHALLGWWWPRVAIAVSLVTLVGLAWLVRAIAVMKDRPVLVSDDGLLLRVGAIKAMTVAPDAVARVRTDGWDRAAIKARSTLNLALIAWPNVMVDLSRPHGRRAITSVAHRLDDPAGFATAVAALKARHG